MHTYYWEVVAHVAFLGLSITDNLVCCLKALLNIGLKDHKKQSASIYHLSLYISTASMRLVFLSDKKQIRCAVVTNPVKHWYQNTVISLS